MEVQNKKRKSMINDYKQKEGRTGLTDAEVKRESNLMEGAVGEKEYYIL